MKNNELSKQKKGLYTLALVNVSIWAISLIALAILHAGIAANQDGMFTWVIGNA